MSIIVSPETALVGFLLNPIISGMLKGKLKKEMLCKPASRLLFDIVYKVHGAGRDVVRQAIYEATGNDITDKDKEQLVYVLDNSKIITKSDLKHIIKQFETHIRKFKALKGFEACKENGFEAGWQELKEAVSFHIPHNRLWNFSLEEDRMEASKGILNKENVLASYYQSINTDCMYGGHIKGTVAMLMGETGIGKSNFTITEGAYFLYSGHKVLHIFLGDLLPEDIQTRYISSMTCFRDFQDLPIMNNMEALMNREKIVKEYGLEGELANLRVLRVGASQFNIQDLIANTKYIKNDFPFDAVIIDYDENIKKDNAALYESGADVYNGLEEIVEETESAGFIVSQIKPAFYGHEILTKEAPAESSKKNKIVGMSIGLGRNKLNGKYGTVTLAKNRRGEDAGIFRVQFMNDCSHIKQITEMEYRAGIQSQEGEES